MSGAATQSINAATRCCAVLGHPIRHSASPAMHNAALAELKFNWRYLAFDVRPEELREAIAGAKAMRFAGLNLTVPHKLLAMDMVDALDDSARRWGAVNTIRFEAKGAKGDWKPLTDFAEEIPGAIRAQGFNTDADAITRSLLEELDFVPTGKRIVLLGAGGAGRVAALTLAADGAGELFLINRTKSKAENAAAEIQQRQPATRVHLDYPQGKVDLVVNATSLGLKPGDAMPFDETRFSLKQASAVFDMIYRPAETPLLKAAKAAGCRAANGLGMLLYQGAAALELWTGRPAPIAVMRRALEKNVYGH